MVRRVDGGVIAAVLVVVTAAGTFAQSPTPPVGMEAPGEFIGYGELNRPGDPFAISFPDDWAVYDVSPDQFISDARAGADNVGDDPDLSGAEAAAVGVQHLIEAHSSPDGTGSWAGCSLTLAPSPLEPTERLETMLWSELEALGDVLVGAPDSRILQIDLGPVVMVDFNLILDGSPTAHSMFVYDDFEYNVNLTCLGSERPADSWWSIAETFEFLPVIQ